MLHNRLVLVLDPELRGGSLEYNVGKLEEAAIVVQHPVVEAAVRDRGRIRLGP